MERPPPDQDTLAAWLRLAFTPGMGPVGAQRLLTHFGSPAAVLGAAPSDLIQATGHPRAQALFTGDARTDAHIERSLNWAQAGDHHLITLDDPAYPASLRELPDPPLVLHVAGRIEVLRGRTLAVVGARNATAGGIDNARSFARELSGAGWVVASGLALGVDAGAHEGALEGGAGTVAVLGTGVDIVYPSRHLRLAERIAADGALISELPLGTAPQPGLFPRRNRLIAGLSRGVVVIEAALRSGSLITARLAADFGRDVFALPGSIHSPLARGCHALIRQGARLVESVDDILSEWPSEARHVARPAAARNGPVEAVVSALSRRLLRAIGHQPVLPDTLAQQLGIAPGELSAQLVLLEINGQLQRHPDGRVARSAPSG
jgi:DNA processing protein